MSDNKQLSGSFEMHQLGGSITFTLEFANEGEIRRLTALCEELLKGSTDPKA
jgi:hypothetical protein